MERTLKFLVKMILLVDVCTFETQVIFNLKHKFAGYEYN